MAINQTLFIVGAGASQEADLPFGRQLLEKVADLLDKVLDDDSSGRHNVIREAILLHIRLHKPENNDFTPYKNAIEQLRQALPLERSIDNYIFNHRTNKQLELCCKLAIVSAILDAEKHSKFIPEGTTVKLKLLFDDLTETWYKKLMELINDRCPIENLDDRLQRISFIVFNYDRCIEKFLHGAFQAYYTIDPQTAASYVKKIKIIHPYGAVGLLPWQTRGTSIQGAIFGGNPTPERLLQFSGNIKTFSEGMNIGASDIDNFHKTILDANTIVFLGNHYHQLNMELLKPNPKELDSNRKVRCFATAKDYEPPDIKKCKKLIRRYCGIPLDRINISDISCFDLFKGYSRSISLI